MSNNLIHWYYTKIRKMHKHNFERVKDGSVTVRGDVYSWQRNKCSVCGYILCLDEWDDLKKLPSSIAYGKAGDIWHDTIILPIILHGPDDQLLIKVEA